MGESFESLNILQHVVNAQDCLIEYEICEETFKGDKVILKGFVKNTNQAVKIIRTPFHSENLEHKIRFDNLIKAFNQGVVLADNIFLSQDVSQVNQYNTELFSYVIEPYFKTLLSVDQDQGRKGTNSNVNAETSKFERLSDAIASKELDYSRKQRLFHNLTIALKYLHQIGEPHGEINPKNIWIENQFLVYLRPYQIEKNIPCEKLCKDPPKNALFYSAPEVYFGEVAKMQQQQQSFQAIESIQQQKIGYDVDSCLELKADLWGLGCIFAEMFFSDGIPLFVSPSFASHAYSFFYVMGIPDLSETGYMSEQQHEQLLNQLIEESKESNLPLFGHIMNRLSAGEREVFNALLEFNPMKRVECSELLEYAFFTPTNPANALVATENQEQQQLEIAEEDNDDFQGSEGQQHYLSTSSQQQQQQQQYPQTNWWKSDIDDGEYEENQREDIDEQEITPNQSESNDARVLRQKRNSPNSNEQISSAGESFSQKQLKNNQSPEWHKSSIDVDGESLEQKVNKNDMQNQPTKFQIYSDQVDQILGKVSSGGTVAACESIENAVTEAEAEKSVICEFEINLAALLNLLGGDFGGGGGGESGEVGQLLARIDFPINERSCLKIEETLEFDAANATKGRTILKVDKIIKTKFEYFTLEKVLQNSPVEIKLFYSDETFYAHAFADLSMHFVKKPSSSQSSIERIWSDPVSQWCHLIHPDDRVNSYGKIKVISSVNLEERAHPKPFMLPSFYQPNGTNAQQQQQQQENEDSSEQIKRNDRNIRFGGGRNNPDENHGGASGTNVRDRMSQKGARFNKQMNQNADYRTIEI